jgi:hypothetical protein
MQVRLGTSRVRLTRRKRWARLKNRNTTCKLKADHVEKREGECYSYESGDMLGGVLSNIRFGVPYRECRESQYVSEMATQIWYCHTLLSRAISPTHVLGY